MQNETIARRWLVAYTQAQGEAKARDALEAAGFDAYLPTQRIARKPRHVRGKTIPRIMVDIPLFSRYLFVEAGSPLRPILAADGVIDVLKVNDAPVTVPDFIVDQIRHRARMGAYDQATRIRLLAGDEVVLVSGVLDGYTGRVVRAPRSENRVELEVSGIEVVTTLDQIRKAG